MLGTLQEGNCSSTQWTIRKSIMGLGCPVHQVGEVRSELQAQRNRLEEIRDSSDVSGMNGWKNVMLLAVTRQSLSGVESNRTTNYGSQIKSSGELAYDTRGGLTI